MIPLLTHTNPTGATALDIQIRPIICQIVNSRSAIQFFNKKLLDQFATMQMGMYVGYHYFQSSAAMI